MFSLQLKRVIYSGILNIVRNFFVSASAVFVMTTTLFVVGFSLLLGQVVDDFVDTISDKVDVTVYFVPGVQEEQILSFKEKLDGRNDVREVIYTSQVSALDEYRKRHENDPDRLEALQILEANPFRARLSIRAFNADNFESIAKFLQNEDILSENETITIDKIDYYDNREIIERLTVFVETLSFFSLVVITILVLISFLITFNMIRLIIYLSKDEISVMRLIGADDWYIKGPFLISGILYGFFGSAIAMILLYPFSIWFSPIIVKFFGNEDLFSYYITELVFIGIVLLALGVLIGVFSSWLSSGRYLK